jgi:hypothetical protein
MNAKSRGGNLEPLLRKLLGTADVRKLRGRAIESLATQFADISASDYRRRLRDHFSAREIRCLVAAMELNVPGLNRKPFPETNIDSLRAVAHPLRATLKPIPFGPGLDDLRGFYVPAPIARKRAMIFLNTTHDRIAVASTFWHELGHHLLDRLGEKAKSIKLLYRDDFSAHMADPSEVIGDTMVVLAAYPKAAARQLFGRQLKGDRSPDAYEMVLNVRRYLSAVGGFEFEKEFPPADNLHYLAGMIHLGKLRWALLAEYGI